MQMESAGQVSPRRHYGRLKMVGGFAVAAMALVLVAFSAKERPPTTSLAQAMQQVHAAAAQKVMGVKGARAAAASVKSAAGSKLADDTAKNLAVAAAVKSAVGAKSEEGQDLKKKGFGMDMKEIAKVQEEAKAAADAEIDAAVTSAKDSAAASYQATRAPRLPLQAPPSSNSLPPPPLSSSSSPSSSSSAAAAAAPAASSSVHALLLKALKLQQLSPHSKEASMELSALQAKLIKASKVVGASLGSAESLEEGQGDVDDAEANALYKQAIADLLKRLQSDINLVDSGREEPREEPHGEGEGARGSSASGGGASSRAEASPPTPPQPAAGSTSGSAEYWDLTAAVDVECGKVRGVLHNDVRLFKGIPYALAPTGARRWHLPLPSNAAIDGVPMGGCWSGTLEAREFGAVCPQSSDPFFSPKETQDESCLFLNVYAPHITSEQAAQGVSELLPVVVFVHGGGNIHGAGSRYDVSGLARRGFVAVTLNYRLGALGFLALASLSHTAPSKASGNYGIADIAMGLEWVKANIRGFGGDPGAVTLMGQGSGATNVLALSVSPLAKKDGAVLFARALLLSPAPRFDTQLKAAEEHDATLPVQAGCLNAADPATEASCLRALSVADLLRYSPMHAPPYWDARSAGVDAFDLPIAGKRRDGLVIVDGAIVPLSSWEAFTHPDSVAHVPFMATVMAEESDADPRLVDTPAEYEHAVTERLQTFGSFWTAPRGDVKIDNEALALYPASAYASPLAAYETMVTDLRMLCPLKRLLGLCAASSTMPVYLGVNTIRLRAGVSAHSLSSNGISSPLRPAPAFASRHSFHALDLILYFQDESHYQLKGADLHSAQGLQEVFDHFVRTGSTEGFNHRTAVSAKAYTWKPVSDAPDFEVTDSLNYHTNVDVAVIKGSVTDEFHVIMEGHYHGQQCDLWSRDAIDRTYAAAA